MLRTVLFVASLAMLAGGALAAQSAIAIGHSAQVNSAGTTSAGR